MHSQIDDHQVMTARQAISQFHPPPTKLAGIVLVRIG